MHRRGKAASIKSTVMIRYRYRCAACERSFTAEDTHRAGTWLEPFMKSQVTDATLNRFLEALLTYKLIARAMNEAGISKNGALVLLKLLDDYIKKTDPRDRAGCWRDLEWPIMCQCGRDIRHAGRCPYRFTVSAYSPPQSLTG
jgi:hypothetical protein